MSFGKIDCNDTDTRYGFMWLERLNSYNKSIKSSQFQKTKKSGQLNSYFHVLQANIEISLYALVLFLILLCR
jgi:hypothetical protein